MAQYSFNVDYITAPNPRLYNGDLQIFVDGNTSLEFDTNDAKKFYHFYIGSERIGSKTQTCCMVTVMSIENQEYQFEFPLDQSAKALEWFHIIHEILTPEKRGFFKWTTSKVVPSRT